MSSDSPREQSPPAVNLEQLTLQQTDSNHFSPANANSAQYARRMTAQPAPSPPLPLPASAGAPASPSGNRFGLALNFIKGRPRGLSSAGAGGRSPGATGSPSGELPPSPSAGDRTGGYGFPALRRSISKRATTTLAANGTPSSPAGAPEASGSRAHQRSGSQPGLAASGAPSSAETSQTRQAASTTQPGPVENTGPLTSVETHKLRLVPHLESSRSLHFEPIDRDLNAFNLLRVGRFTDRAQSGSNADPLRVAFKSKVVSRGHAEVWCDESGKFFIKDTKSSSGTFLNHIRLSAPGAESRAYPLKDGDILQLGVDYQGGTEEIYRCVKMRVELNRTWQRGMNAYNTAALAQLRALGGGAATPASTDSKPSATIAAGAAAKQAAATASVTDCCICLYPVTVCQALFIAPCSHVTHFKCIRPLIHQNYPGFSCPLCRTYADLEADVEIEPLEDDIVPAAAESDAGDCDQPMEPLEEVDEPRNSRAPSVRILAESSRRSSLAMLGSDQLSALSATNPSRPQSIHSPSQEPASGAFPAEEADVVDAQEREGGTASAGVPIAFSTPVKATSSETEAWLANAATPPNSTFLSTLADSGQPLNRSHAPVSLDMALNGFGGAGPSSSAAAETSSFGSGTDAARDEDEPATGPLAGGKGKGKAVEREREATAFEDEGKRVEDGPQAAVGTGDEMQGILST